MTEPQIVCAETGCRWLAVIITEVEAATLLAVHETLSHKVSRSQEAARQEAIAAMTEAWLSRAADRIEASPDDHCAALFDAARAARRCLLPPADRA